MNTVDVLERAIKQLEQMKERATWLPWYDVVDDLTDDVEIVHDSEVRAQVCWVGGWGHPRAQADAELIVALSRTVDPILDFLRFARGLFGAQIQGEQAAATVDLAVYLARSVLGEVEQ